MAAAFFLALASIFVPVLLFLQFCPGAKTKSFYLLPLGAALQTGLLALFAQLGHRIIDAGWTQWGLTTLLAGGVTCLALNYLTDHVRAPTDKWRNSKTIAIIALVALVGSLDGAYLLSKQGWSFQDKTLLSNETSYFSHPFQHDGQRHVILVEAISRRDNSPFLAHSRLTYPLSWYHFASLQTAPVGARIGFAPVHGVVLSTLFLSISFLGWLLFLVRPALFLFLPVGVAFITIGLAHADAFNFLYSLAATGKPAIESNGGVLPKFMRNFSLKFAAITSPSQVFFLIFLSVYLALENMRAGIPDRLRKFAQGAFFSLALIASPAMAVTFFPAAFVIAMATAFVIGNTKRLLPLATCFVSYSIAGIVLLWISSGEALWAAPILPIKNGLSSPLLNPIVPLDWLLAPLLWVGTAGLIGVALTALVLMRITEKQKQAFQDGALLFLIAGGIFFHYVVTSIELRRYYSLLCVLLIPLAVAKLLPQPKKLFASVPWRLGIQATALFAISLHAYFIFVHTAGPNTIDATLPWKEYFEINAKVEKDFKGLPTIAGVTPGQIFPTVAQATTSFVSPSYARALGTYSSFQDQYLRRIRGQSDIPSYALGLGYRAMVWGPIEERVWGERVRSRFLDTKGVFAQAGEVKLVRITDNLGMSLSKKYDPKTAKFHYEFAQALAKGNWLQEALDHYYEVVRLDPKNAHAHNGAGLILSRFGQTDEAGRHFLAATRIDPKLKDAFNNLGALFIMAGRNEQAIDSLKKAMSIAPDSEVYVNLAQAYGGMGKADEAVKYFLLALKTSNGVTRVQALLGLGDVYTRQGDFERALVQYRTALKAGGDHEAVYVKIGNCLAFSGKMGDAIESYNHALALNPRYEPALRALGSLSSASSS